MDTYTGLADANGDFNIAFGGIEYSAGEKIIVTAEKNTAIKSIELYAPSDTLGGGVIQFSGSLVDFPNNIGVVTLSQIENYAGNAMYASNTNLFTKARGLIVKDALTFGSYCFYAWAQALSLSLNMSHITDIPAQCFRNWSALTEINIPEGVSTIQEYAFTGASACLRVTLPTTLTRMYRFSLGALTSCDEIICNALTPPIITSETFYNLKSTCAIKVPAGSIAAYQAAANWSAFAARIQAI